MFMLRFGTVNVRYTDITPLSIDVCLKYFITFFKGEEEVLTLCLYRTLKGVFIRNQLLRGFFKVCFFD